MKNVLIFAGCPHATVTLYRCQHLQEQFEQIGYRAVVQEWRDDLEVPSTAAGCDLLILQRVAMSAPLRRLIDAMHQQGKPVIFDTDDLVFEPSMIQWHRGAARLPAHEHALYADGVQRYQATLEACDFAFTASPVLAELAQRHGKPAFVHRNAVGREMQQVAERLSPPLLSKALSAQERGPGGEANPTLTLPSLGRELSSRQPDQILAPPLSPGERHPAGTQGGEVVIGYGSGTPTHDVDFAEAVPALLDILSRYPQVELWLAGPLELPRELALFGPRIRRFPLRDWQGYLELASRFTIALAPLEQGNIFCRAKSEIKWMEAGLLGIPVVASRVDPFLHAIEVGQTGLLASTTAEWIAALERLINEPAQRQAIGAAAQRKVAAHYSLATRAQELAEIMQQIEASTPSTTQVVPRPRLPDNQSSAPTRPEVQTSPPGPSPTGRGGAGGGGEVPLVLNWIVTEPFAGSGGHLGVIRMVKHLVEFGHECHIYVVPIDKMHDATPAQIQQFVDLVFMRTGAHFHRWNGRVYDADATIATYWSTAYQLATLPNPGRAYYFVQDFEPYFYPMGSDYVRAEQTYRLGHQCITLGPWLAKLMREQYGATADHFDFSVDTDIYWPQAQPRPSHPRVTFYARPSTPRRAYEIGIAALEQVKARQPNVEIIFYGANQLDPHPNFHATNLGIRNQFELATLYSTCDVGLAISLTNPSFVPFEMMACKCAVVDIRSERVVGLLNHGENALLADPTPESIANAILQLLWDKAQRQQLVERAYQQVRAMSWTQSARQIEQVLLRDAPPPQQRRFARRAQGQGADALLWQIHQLLDHKVADQTQVAQLETTLQRALTEKAQLAEQLRQTEQALYKLQTQQQTVGRRLRQLGTQALEQTPGWQVGAAWLTKMSIGPEPLQQRFHGQQSHLASLAFYFAAASTTPTGSLHVALYEEDQQGRLLVEATILAAAVLPDQPYVVAFEPQPYSRDRAYLLTITLPAGATTFGYALWAYFRPQLPQSKLLRGTTPLRGQIAIQPGYTPPGLALPVPATANPWAKPPRPLPTVWRAAGQHGVQEGTRLTRNVITALRTRGFRGLGTEILNYVRWQLKK